MNHTRQRLLQTQSIYSFLYVYETMSDKVLYVVIPEQLKYRLDLYALKNRLTLKEATEQILEKTLPEYKE